MKSFGVLQDTHKRIIRDLRVSITDRCNLRCAYCLPETEEAANFYRPQQSKKGYSKEETKLGYPWKPRAHILTFEEITRVIRIASSLGVNKVRITGGEPLLRRDVQSLLTSIAALGTIDDLSLTSNGTHFPRLARRLKKAGLSRITFSLDSLNRENFRKITGRDGLDDVLESIRLAKALDLTPVKVNAVIIRGLNDHEIEALAKFALKEQIVIRMIEFMPLDSGRAWQRDHVVPGREILERVQAEIPTTFLPSRNAAETASRWSLGDGRAELGIIAPVTQPFCSHCNRIRLTADGNIRTCLFSVHEHDLKPILRDGSSDNELATELQQIIWKKEPGHQIGQPDFIQPERSMSGIGG